MSPAHFPASEAAASTAPEGAPMTAQRLAFSELNGPPGGDSPLASPTLGADARQPSNPLHHVKATLTVCVGTAEVRVGELLNAQEHQVIRLDRLVDGPVDILLEGAVIARGTLVAVGEHFGVRITELPFPLAP